MSNDVLKIRAGFVGFGEVNTPREFIDNRCQKAADELKKRGIELVDIQIRILEGKWVVISKNKAPAIHFVIHNPQLRKALENMVIPVYDKDDTL